MNIKILTSKPLGHKINKVTNISKSPNPYHCSLILLPFSFSLPLARKYFAVKPNAVKDSLLLYIVEINFRIQYCNQIYFLYGPIYNVSAWVVQKQLVSAGVSTWSGWGLWLAVLCCDTGWHQHLENRVRMQGRGTGSVLVPSLPCSPVSLQAALAQVLQLPEGHFNVITPCVIADKVIREERTVSHIHWQLWNQKTVWRC